MPKMKMIKRAFERAYVYVYVYVYIHVYVYIEEFLLCLFNFRHFSAF
jgi:hypothetical protein